jgi:phospholipid-binding lipoprotein MlaA
MRCAHGRVRPAIACVLALLVTGCASMPRDASLSVSDPHEATNRQVLSANQKVLGPASEAVKTAIPGPVHERLHDLNSNLKEPRIFLNDVLQMRLDAAARTLGRFALNTTFGIGGLFDVASREGIAQQSGDFGQTLFVWGVADGPYVVLPYMGPATTRDAVGSVVDVVGNPLGWLIATQIAVSTTQMAVSAGTTSLDAADRLGQLKQAEDASIDFYSFIRSGYYQTRRAELREAVGLPNVIESPATELDDPGDASPSVAAAPSPSVTAVPGPPMTAAPSPSVAAVR